jgi:polyisoprenoid-binding protein YceI
MRRHTLVVRSTCLFVALAALSTHAGDTPSVADTEGRLELALNSGTIEFVAVGWPSALRIRGKGQGATGRLTLERQSLSGQVSFPLDSLDTGIALRNRHMREQYLETGKYPHAVFKPTSVALKRVPAAAAFSVKDVPFEGRLDLHGTEHPVRGAAHVTRRDAEVKVDAVFDVHTSDFGISTPQYMGITVAEDVKVTVRLSGRVESPKRAEP